MRIELVDIIRSQIPFSIPVTNLANDLTYLPKGLEGQVLGVEGGVVKWIDAGSGGLNITQQDIDNWNESFSWGDHHDMGYLTEETDPTVPQIVKEITQANIDFWNSNTGDKHFTFEQSTPALSWVINHNLDKNPSVEVVDTAGTALEGSVTHLNTNTLRIDFNFLNAGTAFLN